MTAAIRAIALQGTFAFVATEISGIHLIDVADPANTEEIDNIDTGFYVQNLVFDENYVYIADGHNGIYIIEFQEPGVGINGQQRSIINDFYVAQNYPNPFNPSTQIRYNLPKSTEVCLTIYNIQGQEIRKLVKLFQHAGIKSVIRDGLDDRGNKVTSGLYLYRVDAGEFSVSKKIILVW